jgi:thymidylate synthase (FAD)
MHPTAPTVYLIARPAIDLDGMRDYLRDVGGESWLDLRLGEAPASGSGESGDPSAEPVSGQDAGTATAPSGGELITEFGGRACYRSWEPGLNPNVSRIRTDRQQYFANILRSGHGSVLEHANYSFAIRNCSRVFTHELVRHRAGSAFSQESLRYVRLTDIGFRVPPALEPVREQVLAIVEQLEEFQVKAAAELGIDGEGVPFHVKKEVTSALRRLAPIGLSTDIIWTANVRTLRHVIEMRTAEGAEEELRLVFDKVARLMRAEAPNLFQDFARHEDGAWVPEHRKV